ncbi:L-threonylcarbamoyladenylate synthase [Piscinibacter sakaiensis]|uniref:L-threonylcarbamoyladenylate synthase n=1 Tax=Piscinibacter sakaiensis TaxID=1547922 RepID=UPI003AAEB064
MLLNGFDPASIERGADQLAAGRLLAFPTETVYGLGARADSDDAVASIYRAKGRPADHPLIVHVADQAGAARFAARWSPLAERLTTAFWPGPLTVIVDRSPPMGAAAAGGQDSIGLRCPAHPVARALLQAAAARGVAGVAAPSANQFGRVSPTTAAHVEGEFPADLLVLDGGPCPVGIESSIVDCRGELPVLLRPGMLTRRQIEAAAGCALADRGDDAPRVSGSLDSHYAPRARVRLMDGGQLKTALQVLGPGFQGLAVYSHSVPPLPARSGGPIWRTMPPQAELVARELFSVLREFDAKGVQLIWVEQPPPGVEWDGVRDRLQRAASD